MPLKFRNRFFHFPRVVRLDYPAQTVLEDTGLYEPDQKDHKKNNYYERSKNNPGWNIKFL
jgi:hypothetical protein